MTRKRWVLTDTATGTYVETLAVEPEDVGGHVRDYKIEKQRLRGGLKDGVDVLLIKQGSLAFIVVPTRGMNLWKAWLGDHEIGWKSPVTGPVHPAFVPLAEPSGLGWLDGFDELLARCGLESNGAPEFDAQGRLRYGLHGRISNRPAQYVDVEVDGDSGEITVTGVVDESRFLFSSLRLTSTIRTRVGETAITIVDQVENISSTVATMQLLYHINLGQPLLGPGARLIAPAKTIVPRNDHSASAIDAWDRYAGPQAGFREQVYFLEPISGADGRARALLQNTDGTWGISLSYAVEQLPYFSLWKNTAAASDGYVTGLEPGTNFPNPRSFEQQHGRVVHLAPGERRTFELRLDIHPDAASVQHAAHELAQLQGTTKTRVLKQPLAEWCA